MARNRRGPSSTRLSNVPGAPVFRSKSYTSCRNKRNRWRTDAEPFDRTRVAWSATK